MYKKPRFRPKIRTFRDLEVYQKALESAVLTTKNILPELKEKDYILQNDMITCSLDIPNNIAKAHSYRFSKKGLDLLDKAMSQSNQMVVYLEEIRDIYSIEKILIEEVIKRYMYNRRKIFNLYNSWKKYV